MLFLPLILMLYNENISQSGNTDINSMYEMNYKQNPTPSQREIGPKIYKANFSHNSLLLSDGLLSVRGRAAASVDTMN